MHRPPPTEIDVLPLERLAQEAAALGSGGHPGPEAEAARQLQICNACRYCEGFCAVFPAMTRRLQFPTLDVHYLANLCHGCGACLHACAYASPHEFKLDLPPALARVRLRTWTAHAWPAAFGRAYERNGLVLSLALAAALALFLVLALAQRGTLWGATGPQGFYTVFPHGLMVALFAPVFAFALLALGIGVSRFWRAQAPGFEEELGREREALLFFPMFECLDDALVVEFVHDVLGVVGAIRIDDRMNKTGHALGGDHFRLV